MRKPILSSHPNYALAFMIVLMVALGSLRVVDTYRIFWQTWDEAAHIAAGMQWLEKGIYTFEPAHPPLARVMSALGLYLNGIRAPDPTLRWWDEEGNAILLSEGQYERNLALARIGILPFFVIASLAVALWAKSLGGTTLSLLSTLLFTTLPPVLAHAGNATLDMACTAFVAAVLFSLVVWLRRPSLFQSIVLGITTGLALLSKFSALFFLLPAGGLIIILWSIQSLRKRRIEKVTPFGKIQWVIASAVAFLFFALTIWAGYRFSVATILSSETRPHHKVDQVVGAEGIIHNITYSILENTLYPAPEFFLGIKDSIIRSSYGHIAYLLGDIRTLGWWYFYPVVLLAKTPLPFILLSLIGFFCILRRVLSKDSECFELCVPAIAFVCILAVGMGSHVQNGLRQMLSVYPPLAIMAGYGAFNLINLDKKSRLAGLGLVTIFISWHLLSSFGAHPDYLAYFNELAGSHPEDIVVDSDLDWGQDLKRLSLTLEDLRINQLTIKIGGTADMEAHVFNLPTHQTLQPYQRTTGWIAVDVYYLTLGTLEAPYDQFAWLREYQPIERVGKSIWLYYIPEK